MLRVLAELDDRSLALLGRVSIAWPSEELLDMAWHAKAVSGFGCCGSYDYTGYSGFGGWAQRVSKWRRHGHRRVEQLGPPWNAEHLTQHTDRAAGPVELLLQAVDDPEASLDDEVWEQLQAELGATHVSSP